MKSAMSFVFSLFLVIPVIAQDEFVKNHEQDGIVFKGMWKLVKKSDPESPLQLKVLVENTNEYRVLTTFTVVFFDTGIESETSTPITLCIKPGKLKKGRKYGLCLISEGISNEKIKSEEITWGVSDVEIEKSEDCK